MSSYVYEMAISVDCHGNCMSALPPAMQIDPSSSQSKHQLTDDVK